MYDHRACKIIETHLVQPTPAPFPEATHWIDQGCYKQTENNVRATLHAPDYRTGDNGRRRCRSAGSRLAAEAATELKELDYPVLELAPSGTAQEFLVLVGPYTDLDRARQDEAQLRSRVEFRNAKIVTS